jgi:hypothetical protein
VKALIIDIDAFNKFEAQARNIEVLSTFNFEKFKNDMQVSMRRQLTNAQNSETKAASKYQEP